MLHEMANNGIIEPADEATEWCDASMVLFFKRNQVIYEFVLVYLF